MTFKGSGEPSPVARHQHVIWWLLVFVLSWGAAITAHRILVAAEQIEALQAQVARLEQQVRVLSAPKQEQPEEVEHDAR